MTLEVPPVSVMNRIPQITKLYHILLYLTNVPACTTFHWFFLSSDTSSFSRVYQYSYSLLHYGNIYEICWPLNGGREALGRFFEYHGSDDARRRPCYYCNKRFSISIRNNNVTLYFSICIINTHILCCTYYLPRGLFSTSHLDQSSACIIIVFITLFHVDSLLVCVQTRVFVYVLVRTHIPV
jgi:hypothetical protein